MLKILLNIAQDSVAGVIAEDSQLRLSQLLKDEGLADAQLQQDIGKLLSNRDVEQVEEVRLILNRLFDQADDLFICFADLCTGNGLARRSRAKSVSPKELRVFHLPTLHLRHQAMPLLAAFGDHGSAPSIQKYNGKDLILLDPYRLTLVVIDKKVRILSRDPSRRTDSRYAHREFLASVRSPTSILRLSNIRNYKTRMMKVSNPFTLRPSDHIL